MTKRDELGFSKIDVRFFINEYNPYSEDGLIEVNETEFLEALGAIEYQRDSVCQNGVRQICLTKNPFGE